MSEHDTVRDKACGDGAACFEKTATVRRRWVVSWRLVLRGKTTLKHAAIVPRCSAMAYGLCNGER